MQRRNWQERKEQSKEEVDLAKEKDSNKKSSHGKKDNPSKIQKER